MEKSVVQNWCMSSEGIPQEVFCTNNTTWNSVVELISVLCQVCANLENIFKIHWDQEEVVFGVIYATQRIAKEGVSHQLYVNLENILKTH